MYYLRDQQTKENTLTIARLLLKEQYPFISPIQRHEVAFILGQLDPLSNQSEIRSILEILILDETEYSVSRHESIIAYGSIYQDTEATNFLKFISESSCPLVSESAKIYL